MPKRWVKWVLALLLGPLPAHGDTGAIAIELGTRPLELVAGMDPGPLKDKLESCKAGPFGRTTFSIGHRGAPLRFPEHTRESYENAARQGAGIVECDVTFTADGELVCRHAECDLHGTTNIVSTPLNAACSVPSTGPGSRPKCCASDLTLLQFESLKGTNSDAQNGTLMTLKQSVALNERLGVHHAPELKAGDPARIAKVFGSQRAYAQQLIDILVEAHVDPARVWLQSFDLDDVLYWIEHTPEFGRQAVYLVDVDTRASPWARLANAELVDLRNRGVRIFAPPMQTLLAVENGSVVPSQYALDIRRARLDIVTWTLERADLRNGASKAGDYYAFDPAGAVIRKESDMYVALDVLAQRVGIRGIFSDWPATVTYYANCMGVN